MASIPISKTKIVLPKRRGEILKRERLMDLVFDGLDQKLVLISAPAGYGKTSLLIDVALDCEYTCCWLSLDEVDRIPERFVAYLLASITEKYPGFGSQTQALLEGIPSLEKDIESVAVSLVNETIQKIPEHVVFILDDFHLLEGVQPVYDLLNRFIQLMGEHCHVIIASRTLTPIADLPLMVGRNQVTGLAFSDLAFQREEIQALIWQNEKKLISDEEAQKLFKDTEGWVTGLRFSNNGFRPVDTAKPVASREADLFEYIGQQVMERQTPELREFLLRTSVMGEFNAELCEQVLAPLYKKKQDWDGMIRAITQNNLFVLPVGTDGSSLRYHHLFREYLFKQLEKERKKEVPLILSGLGRAYENMGEWEKAYDIFKQLKNTDALAGLIEHASFNNLHNVSRMISNWLRDLPPSLLQSRPSVLSVSGTIKLTKGQFLDGIEELNRAIEAFRQAGDIPQLVMALIRRSTGHRYLGDYSTAIRDADEAIACCEGREDLQSLLAEALHVKGIALYRDGMASDALVCYERAYDIVFRLNETPSVLELLQEIGIAQQALGDFSEAEHAYHQVLSHWKENSNLWWQTGILNNIGNLHHQSGEYKKSAASYQQGILCARQSYHARMEALISIGLGDLCVEVQDFETASRCYQDAERMLQDHNDLFLLFSLRAGQTNLALFQGNLREAKRSIASMEAMVKPDQSHYENGHFDWLKGKFHLLSGEVDKAVSVLESAVSHFKQAGLNVEHAAARIWLSAAYLAAHKLENAVENLKETLSNKRVEHVSLVAISQTRQWLDGLKKSPDIERVYSDATTRANKVVARFADARREFRLLINVVEVPAAPLSVKGFGHATVQQAGKELSLSDWQTQSVRELFFFFFTHKARTFTWEQVGEILWSNMDESPRIHRRFKNEIYRLRHAVKGEIVLHESQRYGFNRGLDYEYDVAAFESFLDHAKSAQTVEEQIEFYRKAVDLVTGPYMDDIYFDWVLAERTRLDGVYLFALNTLADLYQKQGHLEEGLVMCQRAVKYDPAHEESCQMTMQLYHRLGNIPAVIQTYQAHKKALSELSLPTSPKTESLYRKLTS